VSFPGRTSFKNEPGRWAGESMGQGSIAGAARALVTGRLDTSASNRNDRRIRGGGRDIDRDRNDAPIVPVHGTPLAPLFAASIAVVAIVVTVARQLLAVVPTQAPIPVPMRILQKI